MKVDYKCKFCGVSGSVEVDDLDTSLFQVEKWKPVLVCNRCADYYEAKRGLMDRVRACCITVIQTRQQKNKDEIFKVEGAARSKLESLTKKLATLVCDYYRKPNFWHNEFVVLLMDMPEKYWAACSEYIRSVKAGRI